MGMIKRLAVVAAVAVAASGCGGGAPEQVFAQSDACALLTTAVRGTPVDPASGKYQMVKSAPGSVLESVQSCRAEWNTAQPKVAGADAAAGLDLAGAEDWSKHSVASSQGGYEIFKDTTKAGGGCRYQIRIPGTGAAVHLRYLDWTVTAAKDESCPVAERMVAQILPGLPKP